MKLYLFAAAALLASGLGIAPAAQAQNKDRTETKPASVSASTRADRKEERAKRRAEMRAANQRGELSAPGEAYGSFPNPPAGKYQSRSAEHQAKEAERPAATK